MRRLLPLVIAVGLLQVAMALPLLFERLLDRGTAPAPVPAPLVQLAAVEGWRSVGTMMVGNMMESSVATGAEAGPAAVELSAPTEIACRPVGNSTDQVEIRWKDTDGDADDFQVFRAPVGSNDFSELATVDAATCNGSDICSYIDANASTNTVYRYRVRARADGNTTGFSATCREPLRLESAGNNFRVYYRLEECPALAEGGTCTENVTVSGQNKHAVQLATDNEATLSAYINLGFNDYSIYKGSKPYPIDLYPCNNGCANGAGIQIPPDNMLGADYVPATGTGSDYEVFVVLHEAFHAVQGAHGGTIDPYYKWVIEGQARAIEDKVCIFPSQAQCTIWDDQVKKWYKGQVKTYLGIPEQSLMEASYNAALFWTYVTEQFATLTDEPALGMDVLLNFWKQNEMNIADGTPKNGINTLNDMLDGIGSPRRFADIFQDFAVANYAKDYLTAPVPAQFAKYNYIDEETYTGGTYGNVKLTESSVLDADDTVFGTTSLQSWGARYFEMLPTASVPVINVEINALPGTPYPLYVHILAIDGGAIVSQWSATGTSVSQSIVNNGYERVAVVVASSNQAVNFDYGFNLADGLFILAPDVQKPAAVGEAAAPKKFLLWVQVLDVEGKPVSGIDTSQFTITVDSLVINPPANVADNPIIGSSYIAGRYLLNVRAPTSPGCTVCDLTVAYSAYSDTKPDALVYGPVPDTDNMIIIDRSGSMLGAKIAAAQDAARLYVDSYSTGDRIGVVSYSDTTNLEFPLANWSNANSQAAQDAIDGMDPPFGLTANGAGLREGMAQLNSLGSPNPAWAMVLLSDGTDTVGDTNDHIPAFLTEYKEARDNGDQVPVIHVVAVGDDADGVQLQKVSDLAQGIFMFLPETGGGAGIGATEAVNSTLDGELSLIYRVFAESVLDEQQVFNSQFARSSSPMVSQIPVENGASEGIFVLKFFPADASTDPFIALTAPGSDTPIAPTINSAGHRLWRIPAPAAGDWRLVIRCGTENCPENYLVEAALVSDLVLHAFVDLEPETERLAGMPVPVLAILSDIAPLGGATVNATSKRTGEVITLYDDGLHGDGAANDGVYRGVLVKTSQAGGYPVVVEAKGNSPFAGPFERVAHLSFFLEAGPDTDEDRLPDWWEDLYPCMDPLVNDAGTDFDGDGLPAAQEYENKTNPCIPDTDGGGESDGSEVGRGADPLFPGDDGIKPPTLKAWPGVGRVILQFLREPGVGGIHVERAPTPEGPFVRVVTGVLDPQAWVDGSVENGMLYCYRIVSELPRATNISPVSCTIPKTDPHPPHGGVGLPRLTGMTVPRTLTLLFHASDDPSTEEHPPFDGKFLTADALVSGVVEMKVSNRPDFAGADWEPFVTSKQWTLDPDASGTATVFVVYRDGEGNVSEIGFETFVVDDEAAVPVRLYIPEVSRD